MLSRDAGDVGRVLLQDSVLNVVGAVNVVGRDALGLRDVTAYS